MILEDCNIFDGRAVVGGSIEIDGNVIGKVGRVEKVGGERVDVKGRLVLPGLICAHGHAYSAFAFSQKGKSSDFLGALQNFWCPLDQSLDRETVYWSAVLTGLSYLRNGVTIIIDHHASPNFLRGSLSTLAKGFREVGIRSCLSYEVTDRYGERKAEEAIKENERFIREYGGGEKDESVSALFGLHASFTLNRETLQRCADLAKKLCVGFHLHLAEGKVDAADAKERFGKSLVEHLKDEGILNGKTLAAHCVDLDGVQIKNLGETGARVITNPRSNANNGVGIMNLEDMVREGILVGIGNDGLGYDMLEEIKSLQFMQSLRAKKPSVLSLEILNEVLFSNNSKIASDLFKRRVGEIKEGAYADLVIMDSKPYSSSSNLANMDSSMVDSVMVDGKWVIRHKKFLSDVERYTEKIANALGHMGSGECCR